GCTARERQRRAQRRCRYYFPAVKVRHVYLRPCQKPIWINPNERNHLKMHVNCRLIPSLNFHERCLTRCDFLLNRGESTAANRHWFSGSSLIEVRSRHGYSSPLSQASRV